MGAHMHFTTVRLHLLRADFSKALRMQTSGHPACKLNLMQPNLLHATSSNITPVANGHIAYQSDWIAVREYAVERAGARGIYAVVERPNSVVVVPLTPTRRTVLQKQLRFPTGASKWEFPMGATNPGELAADAAQRELCEEVGLCNVALIQLGNYCPMPGLSPQTATVFVAPVDDQKLDAAIRGWSPVEEITEVLAVSLADLPAMIGDGRITDGYSLAGLLLLKLWLDQRGGSHV